MKHFLRFLRLILILINVVPGMVMAQNNDAPLSLVELYTSQGCSSCPPADIFLGDLAKRQDVLALSFHVDYWNYIGWNDPFSDPAFTERQRHYARQLGLRYVYTPQMVVQGSFETTGHKRREVSNFIDQAKTLSRIGINLKAVSDNALTIEIGGWEDAGMPTPDQTYEVWAAVYDKYHETVIKRGENSGRNMENFNVVRTLTKIGEWTGIAEIYSVNLDALSTLGGDGCAIFVQSKNSGKVLGVANINL